MSTSKCQCYGEAMVNSPYWIIGFKTTKKVVSSSWCWTFLSKNRCLKQQKPMEVELQCPWQLKLPKGWVRGVVLRSTLRRNIIPLKTKQWYPGSKDGKGMLVYCNYIQIKKTGPKNQEGTSKIPHYFWWLCFLAEFMGSWNSWVEDVMILHSRHE